MDWLPNTVAIYPPKPTELVFIEALVFFFVGCYWATKSESGKRFIEFGKGFILAFLVYAGAVSTGGLIVWAIEHYRGY